MKEPIEVMMWGNVPKDIYKMDFNNLTLLPIDIDYELHINGKNGKFKFVLVSYDNGIGIWANMGELE